MHDTHVAAECDLGCSLDDDPMLRAMKVLLQRKLAARLHHNALHSVTRSAVDILVIAPRSVDAPVLDPGAIVVCLELLDQRFHLLCLRARADQHGIRGGYDDNVVESDHRGQNGFLRAHKIVAAVQHNDRTIGCIAGRIMIECLPERTPAAESKISASTPLSRNCSATTKRKSALVMTIGRANKSGCEMRASTCWNVDPCPTRGTNCLGMVSRETGHSRVPAPPHMITGTI